jgi:hypothetical protein
MKNPVQRYGTIKRNVYIIWSAHPSVTSFQSFNISESEK